MPQEKNQNITSPGLSKKVQSISIDENTEDTKQKLIKMLSQKQCSVNVGNIVLADRDPRPYPEDVEKYRNAFSVREEEEKSGKSCSSEDDVNFDRKSDLDHDCDHSNKNSENETDEEIEFFTTLGHDHQPQSPVSSNRHKLLSQIKVFQTEENSFHNYHIYEILEDLNLVIEIDGGYNFLCHLKVLFDASKAISGQVEKIPFSQKLKKISLRVSFGGRDFFRV